MIPKKLHQCWFGPSPIPDDHMQWMQGVRKIMPDYEYRLWTNDDLPDTRFVKECIKWRKYALLSDYMRLKIIKSEGGIYLDTDVEVFKPFDPLLDCSCLLGFSQCISKSTPVSNTIIAAEAENDFVAECFEGLTWELNHRLKPAYGVKVGNVVLAKRGLNACGTQMLGNIQILDRDVLYKEYCEHHFAGSWHSKKNFKSKMTSIGYRSTRAANLLAGMLTGRRMYQ